MAKPITINLQAFLKPGRISKAGTRELKVFFLIVCEGEKTEPSYFRSFPNVVGEYIYDLKFEGGGISTKGVVEAALSIKKKSAQQFDRVWAVFDMDSFPDKDFNEAIKRGRELDIRCAWSNEAFELWYLLHFEYREDSMKRNQYKEAIEKAINGRIKNSKAGNAKPFKYEKNTPDMYRILVEYGNQAQAIKWAKKLKAHYSDSSFSKHNPCTTVFQLVEELIGECPKLKEELAEKYRDGK